MSETASESEHATLVGDLEQTRDDPRKPLGLDRGRLVGRYVVLDCIGRGGMGEVYSAWDPELDRKLALKLIGFGGEGREADQQRLLREAQATAKLNHPNVITVHDVGTHEGRVFVAMEFVAGGTLREYVDRGPHAWREVLARFVPAGRGLAAAHRAGLVHRDFKPANVLVGDEGRIRVADFGLALALGDATPSVPELDDRVQARIHEASSRTSSLSARLTQTGARLGTPAYMSPEQYEAGEVDARADQFSFCVALWEALYGERPFVGNNLAALMLAVAEGKLREPTRAARVPAWLRKVVARGLARAPAQRWPSMDALLDALERDAGRRSLGWALGGTLVASLALVVGVLASPREAASSDPCDGGERAFGDTYGPTQRDTIAQRLHAEQADATAALLLPRLDAWREQWLLGWREACEATHVEHEQSEDLLDRRMACLARQRDRFAAFVTALGAGEGTLEQEAASTLAELGDPAGCSDLDELRARMSLPADARERKTIEGLLAALDRSAMLLESHELERAEARLRELEAEIGASGWPPLLAEFHYLRGDTLAGRSHYEEAERELGLAVASALALGEDRIAMRALTEQASNLAAWQPEQLDAGLRLLDLADALNLRLGGDASERSRIAVVRAHMLIGGSRNEEALAAAQVGLDAAAQAEPRAGERTAAAEHALGLALFRLGRYVEGKPHVERALALWLDAFGPAHRVIGKAHNALGLYAFVLEQPDEAIRHFEAQLDINRTLQGAMHVDVADVRANLGNAYFVAGRHEDARTQLEQALAIRERELGPDNLYVGHARANLANVLRKLGDLDGALDQATRALAIITAIRGEDHPDLSPGRSVLALVYEARGEWAPAREQYLTSLRLLERPEGGSVHYMFEVLTSLARVDLAADRPRDALAWVSRADALEHDAPPAHEGELEWVAAQVLARLDRPTEARTRAERALALLAESDPDMAAEVRGFLDARTRP